MIARLRRNIPVAGCDPAVAALSAYQSHPGRRPPLGALYGYRQQMNRHRRLVDGPRCLVVVTTETITLSRATTGAILVERALADLEGYLMDRHGRFGLRFGDEHGRDHVGTFRPVAAPNSTLNPSDASALFLNRVIKIWQVRTGRRFVNSWTAGATAVTD